VPSREHEQVAASSTVARATAGQGIHGLQSALIVFPRDSFKLEAIESIRVYQYTWATVKDPCVEGSTKSSGGRGVTHTGDVMERDEPGCPDRWNPRARSCV
jgi:hypothetical protein